MTYMTHDKTRETERLQAQMHDTKNRTFKNSDNVVQLLLLTEKEAGGEEGISTK